MKKTYRAVNFDLDTKAMHSILGSRTKGYRLLKQSMKKLGFSHRQGSGYISNMKMTRADVVNFVNNLKIQNAWLANCVKIFDITNTDGKFYDFTNLLKSSAQAAEHKQTPVSGVNTSLDYDKNNPSPAFLDQVSGLKQGASKNTTSNAKSKSSINENE